MELDDKAITYLTRAKSEGIPKEDAFRVLQSKGYDIGGQSASVNNENMDTSLPPPPSQSTEDYINQETAKMPYEPSQAEQMAQGQLKEINRQIGVIDKTNAEYAPLVKDMPASPMMIKGGVKKDTQPLSMKILNSYLKPSMEKPFDFLNPADYAKRLAFMATTPEANDLARQGGYFALPELSFIKEFKGANLLKNALSGAYQGGTVGAIENNLQGKSTLRGAKEGAMLGGAFGTVVPAAQSTLKGIRNFTWKPIGEAYSFANELLSGVPREHTKRALNAEMSGNSIFKGKYDPIATAEILGTKAQDAINNLKKVTGKATGQQRKALRSINTKIEVKPVLDTINQLVSENTSRSGVSRLDPNDIKAINEVKNLLSGKVYADDLDNVLTRIQAKTKKDINRVKTTSDTGDYVLGEIASKIDELISQKSPAFKNAKTEYSKTMDLQKRLGSKLKDTNINKTLQNINSEANKNAGYYDLFNELDATAPQNLKFMNDAENLIARRSFENLFPGQGGGSGSAQGVANILRVGGGLKNPLMFPLYSPKMQGLGIQGAGKLNSLLEAQPSQEAARKLLLQSLLASPSSI